MVVSALRAWAFLLTTVPGYRLDAHFVETHLGLLAQLLNGSDVDVRGAAGEAIALLWQLGDLSSLPESPRPSRGGAQQHNTLAALAVGMPPSSPAANWAAAAAVFGSPGASNGSPAVAGAEAQLPAAAGEQQSRQQTAAPAAPAAAEQAPAELEDEEEEGVDSLEAIVERMRDLAKNRGDASRLNKGDRATSRGTFRDLLAIIEVGVGEEGRQRGGVRGPLKLQGLRDSGLWDSSRGDAGRRRGCCFGLSGAGGTPGRAASCPPAIVFDPTSQSAHQPSTASPHPLLRRASLCRSRKSSCATATRW